jgi:hypothetical protein
LNRSYEAAVVDPSVLQVLTERLNMTFSAARLARTGRGVPERALFEPVPRRTLLRAACRLGIARELDELDVVASLPLGIQMALRQAIWANLGRSRPAPMRWSWRAGAAHQLKLSEVTGVEPTIVVELRSPVASVRGAKPPSQPV